MTTSESIDNSSAVSNLRFLIGKNQAQEERYSELSRELAQLRTLSQLARARIKTLAQEAWRESITTALNEWKSTRGDEDITLEWVYSRFEGLPAEIALTLNAEFQVHSANHQVLYDAVLFFDELRKALASSRQEA